MTLKTKSEEEILQSSNITRINFLFRVMWVMTLVLFIAIPFKLESLQSLSYWAYTICNILCFAMGFFEKQRYDNRKVNNDRELLLLVLVIFFTQASFNFAGTFIMNAVNIMGYLNFISILLAMYYSCYIKTDVASLKFIGVINIFIAFLFIILSRMDFAYGKGEMWSESLTLGFSNPNMVAMMIFINTVFLFFVKELFKKNIVKYLIVVLIILNIYMIYLTKSRASLVATIIVAAMYLFKNKKLKVRPTIVMFCIIFPLLFLYGYTYLYKHNYYKDFELLGKTIYSGREIYYSRILSELKNYDFGLVFGHFTGFQNTHNSALSLIRFFGLSGMIVYYIYVLNALLKLAKKEFSNKMRYICYVAILAVYVQSCAESAIIIGGGAWIVFMLSLYAIAGNSGKETENVDEGNRKFKEK